MRSERCLVLAPSSCTSTVSVQKESESEERVNADQPDPIRPQLHCQQSASSFRSTNDTIPPNQVIPIVDDDILCFAPDAARKVRSDRYSKDIGLTKCKSKIFCSRCDSQFTDTGSNTASSVDSQREMGGRLLCFPITHLTIHISHVPLVQTNANTRQASSGRFTSTDTEKKMCCQYSHRKHWYIEEDVACLFTDQNSTRLLMTQTRNSCLQCR